MNILVWKTCFKKEYWEYNKLLFWLPVAMAVLIFCTPIIAFMLKDTSQVPWLETFTHFSKLSESPELAKAFFTITMGVFIPFIVIATIIQLYYFLACLYDEKKDLSIYFWRSLPVSDATTVIVKLITGTLLIPAIFMLAATFTIALFLLLGFLFTSVLSIGFDISFWGAWVNASVIKTLFMAWLNLIPSSLWLLPLFTWLMLSSMFANKAPFLWATLPIVFLFVIETLLVHYGVLSHFYLIEVFRNYFGISQLSVTHHMRDMSQLSSVSVNVLSSKVSVIGIIVAAVFLYVTYWLRKNKSHA